MVFRNLGTHDQKKYRSSHQIFFNPLIAGHHLRTVQYTVYLRTIIWLFGGKLVIFVKDFLVQGIKFNEACRKYRKHATDFQTQTEKLNFLFHFLIEMNVYGLWFANVSTELTFLT